jgi:hypothetical protein
MPVSHLAVSFDVIAPKIHVPAWRYAKYVTIKLVSRPSYKKLCNLPHAILY